MKQFLVSFGMVALLLASSAQAAETVIGAPDASTNGYFRINNGVPTLQFHDSNWSAKPYDLGMFLFDSGQMSYRYYNNTTGRADSLLYIDSNGRTSFNGAFRVQSTLPTLELLDTDSVVDPGSIGFFQFNDGLFKYRYYNNSNGLTYNLWSVNKNGDGFFSGKLGIGTITPSTALQVVGETTTNVINITGGSDLSEQFKVSSDAKPGMVVCIDPANPGQLKTSSKAYDKTVAGVISGAGGLQTGMKMGQQGSIADGSHPVALSGRVYVNVDAARGAVQPGDMLTTSNTPGYAMAVKDHAKAQGAVIGKAMTGLKAGQKGLVLVLITLQ